MKRLTIVLLIFWVLAYIAVGYLLIFYHLKIVGDTTLTSSINPNSQSFYSLSNFQFRELFLNLFGSFFTSLAVFVAVFREEIKSNFIYAKPVAEHLPLNEKTEKFSSDNYEATYYETALVVENSGSINAENCEVRITKLEFCNDINDTDKTNHALSNTQGLLWKGTNETKINLFPNVGKNSVSLIMIKPNSVASSSEADSKNAILEIAGIDLSSYYDGSQSTIHWYATFLIGCSNCEPLVYGIRISWNGKWEKRLTEMRKLVKIEKI